MFIPPTPGFPFKSISIFRLENVTSGTLEKPSNED